MQSTGRRFDTPGTIEPLIYETLKAFNGFLYAAECSNEQFSGLSCVFCHFS